MNYNAYIENLKKHCNMMEGARNQLLDNIESTKKEVELKKSEAIAVEKALKLLNETSNVARDKARQHLERMVTMALQYIHDDYCEFVIEPGQIRGVPSAEFYIITEINGKKSKQKPQDSCGGGYVDVISTTLRYAYIKAFNSPAINNAIILDEPGKMVSEQASVKFAEFVKKISEMFDKQTIMVTHNESLELVADHGISISKNNNVSEVSYNNINELTEEELDVEIQV